MKTDLVVGYRIQTDTDDRLISRERQNWESVIFLTAVCTGCSSKAEEVKRVFRMSDGRPQRMW